jgi:hypothetical protein
MSNLTAAYIAGFVDGEGYLSIVPYHHSVSNKIYYKTNIKVANTNKEIIEWLKAEFGGWIYVRKFASDKNYKDAYCWQMSGKNSIDFLMGIQPYLRIKRRQCELLLEKSRIESSRNMKVSNDNREYSEDISNRIEEIYLELRRLNKRGRNVQGERLSEETPIGDATV